MVRAHARQGMPHLVAGVIASGLVAAVVFGARMVAVHREDATILSSAPELFPLKNQGLAFQRVAALWQLRTNGPSGAGEGKRLFSHCPNRFPSFARRRWRHAAVYHFAKNRCSWVGLAR